MPVSQRTEPGLHAESFGETRVCRVCARERPIEVFRLRRSGSASRHTICRACATQRESERQKRRRHSVVHQFTARAIKAENDQTLEALVKIMARRFNGLENMASEWHAAILAAQADGRHCAVLRSFRVIIEMIAVVDRLRPSPSSLSDHDLVRRRNEAVFDMLRLDPHLVLAAAEHLGWRFYPPTTPEEASDDR
jgi:hypothetical protein